MTRQRIIELIAITLMGLCAGWLMGQTMCTPTSPCIALTFNNPNYPSTAVILSCVGSQASTCTQSSLTTYIAKQTLTNFCPSAHTVWRCTSFTQSKNPLIYNDPQPMGATVNYAFEWFTPATGMQQIQVVASVQ